jgi:hypothetical protein
MATQENLDALYCRFIESVINHRRLDHLDRFLAADVVEQAPTGPRVRVPVFEVWAASDGRCARAFRFSTRR